MKGLCWILLAPLALSMPAGAQVAVGYSSITSASAGRVVDTGLDLRSRSSFGIGGNNVEPVDGGQVYDTRTIWRIRDTSKDSSLILRLEDSVFDADETLTDSNVKQASRRESVSVTLLPPLSNNILIRTSISPFAPVIPIGPSDLSTSVFP